MNTEKKTEENTRTNVPCNTFHSTFPFLLLYIVVCTVSFSSKHLTVSYNMYHFFNKTVKLVSPELQFSTFTVHLLKSATNICTTKQLYNWHYNSFIYCYTGEALWPESIALQIKDALVCLSVGLHSNHIYSQVYLRMSQSV